MTADARPVNVTSAPEPTPAAMGFALRIVGDVTPGQPASRTGYGQAAYGNTKPLDERPTWIGIAPDGHVTAFAGKVEYGQNIRTGLAIEVADELRVGIDDVTVILGDTDRVPWDMGTFGSQSTARVGWQLRKAAATAREVLLSLAADRLDLPLAELEVVAGRVAPRQDPARGVSYGELLAGQSIEREITERPAITPPGEFTQMGRQHLERVDAIARVTGSAL